MNGTKPGAVRIGFGPGLVGAAIAVTLWGGALLGPGLVGSVVPPGPTGSASPSTSPEARPSASATPAVDRATLTAILAVDARLTGARDSLSAEVDVTPTRPNAIAVLLRDIKVQLRVGLELADRLAVQPASAALAIDLAEVYQPAWDTIDETLGISLRDSAAYEAGGRSVVAQLASLEVLDGRTKALLVTGEDPGAVPSPSPGGSPSIAPSPPVSPSPSPEPSPSGVAPSPSPSARPGNELKDPGFEALTDPPWTLALADGASATVERDPEQPAEGASSARVVIRRSSDARAGVSLEQADLALSAGRRYVVSVQLRADAPREARLRVSAPDGQTYVTRLVQVDTGWATYTFEFTPLIADPNARFAVDLGRSAATTWVDDAFLGPAEGSS